MGRLWLPPTTAILPGYAGHPGLGDVITNGYSTAILPHHTKFLFFFQNLKFVVIDELHTYRGFVPYA
jgi:hypothetical protein